MGRLPKNSTKHRYTEFGAWVYTRGIKHATVGKALDISRTHVNAICRGRHNPGLELRLAIEKYTGGDIDPVVSWQDDTLEPEFDLTLTDGTRVLANVIDENVMISDPTKTRFVVTPEEQLGELILALRKIRLSMRHARKVDEQYEEEHEE